MCLNPLLLTIKKKYFARSHQTKVFVVPNFVSKCLESSRKGYPSLPMKDFPFDPYEKNYLVPCRRCQECLISRSVSIGIRCHFESLVAKESCFVTLTYDSDHVGDYKLHYDHASKFIKRLRRHEEYHHGNKNIRYAIVGEYGEKHGRPHWHILFFGYAPKDRRRSSTSANKWTSDTLLKLWGKGHVDVGTCSPSSCFYVARYCQKKWKAEDDSYMRQYSDEEKAERKKRKEIFHCSTGLGKEFFLRNLHHFKDDFVVKIPLYDNRKKRNVLRKFPVPSYFRRLLSCAGWLGKYKYPSKYYEAIRERIFKVWTERQLSDLLFELERIGRKLFLSFDLDRILRRRSLCRLRSRLGNRYRLLDNTS